MICLLEERVCNLVLLWCITVIAHHCKLVKLQSSNSEYKPSDLWSYDDIEVARPENQTNIRLVKNHQSDSYYHRSDDRPPVTTYDDHQSSSLRNRDHFGSRTNIEIPIAAKSNDGEISISKKITFNGNNSRANNHPLWFNTLEKSAMSLPASISFNLKNLYNERKSESTKRPQHENPGLVFATKTIPLNASGSNRNKVKYQQPNYEPEYDEPALPPSLPNLEIIPFVASDALDKPKEQVADRKEGIEYIEDETTPMDAAAMIKKFSPPALTEGGFVPRDPTPDELYYTKFNRTYSTSTSVPAPHIIVTEISSGYRVPESPPKIPEPLVEPTHHHQHIEYSTTSTTTTTTQKPTVTTATSTTTTAAPSTTTPVSTTTPTEEPTPSPTTSIVHFLTTKAANHSTPGHLLKHNSTSTSTTTSTTTENPSLEESEEGGEEEESEEEDEETIPISESEPAQKQPPANNTKEEPAEPEDNYLLSNILTMIFDDYAAPSKEKTTLAPPATKKSTPMVRSTTTTTVRPSSTTIPPFKHVYIPPATQSTTTTTTTSSTTESTSTVKSMDKMGFTSTKFSNNKTATMNETQQNQIKYISLPQTFTYNQPVPKTTPKPVVRERPQSHNEIYHSMKSDSVISGLLKLSGCNIFGKMYKTGEQIDELTEPCSRCMCSEAGVHCIQTKC